MHLLNELLSLLIHDVFVVGTQLVVDRELTNGLQYLGLIIGSEHSYKGFAVFLFGYEIDPKWVFAKLLYLL